MERREKGEGGRRRGRKKERIRSLLAVMMIEFNLNLKPPKNSLNPLKR
jgi:hypothetical protein